MLYKLGQQKEFKPVKYFSIDRVFRNESLDATHLAEFHQVSRQHSHTRRLSRCVSGCPR
jgi:phenylalanyl-tRNA synthetase alpha subunit